MNALIGKRVCIDQHQQLIHPLQIVFGTGHDQHVGGTQLTDTAIRLKQGLNRPNHSISGHIDQRCHLHDERRRSIAERIRRGNVSGQVRHHPSRIP